MGALTVAPPGPLLASAIRATNFAPGTSAATDITSATVTVTPNGRTIELVLYCPYVSNSTANTVILSILEGATSIEDVWLTLPAGGAAPCTVWSQPFVPTAGAHTYKGVVSTFGGNPTLSVIKSYAARLQARDART